jgi:hypothetical protein
MTMTRPNAVTADDGEMLSLPWDHFVSEQDRPHVEAFRKYEWKSIRKDLRKEFRWELPENLEPHWARPGKCFYWQEVNSGWVPVGPLTANNASVIAHYLNKGFRLRPPRNGVEVESLLEAADAQAVVEQAVVEKQEETKAAFLCHKHEKLMGFVNWKAYIGHCTRYLERPDESQIPPEIVARASQFPYYCFIHNRAFRNKRLAERHIRDERNNNHESVKQLEVHPPAPNYSIA